MLCDSPWCRDPRSLCCCVDVCFMINRYVIRLCVILRCVCVSNSIDLTALQIMVYNTLVCIWCWAVFVLSRRAGSWQGMPSISGGPQPSTNLGWLEFGGRLATRGRNTVVTYAVESISGLQTI